MNTRSLLCSLCTLLLVLAVTLEPAKEFLAVCVNSSLTITCSTTTSALEWDFIPQQGNYSLAEYEFYNFQSTLDLVDMVGVFKVKLIAKYPLVSTATLDDVDSTHNGTILVCANTPLENRKPDQFAQVTILVESKLHCCIQYHIEQTQLASENLVLMPSRFSICSSES